jgi:diguanylate cyclase (GGDEF)-like protein/PAS domain S-box-containing protein
MATSNQKINIIMIEDNLDEADLIQEMLRSASTQSYNVIHKKSLKDGIDYLKQVGEQIDIALLDLHLPDGSKFELFKSLSNNAPWLPIILLTNLNDEELAAKIVRNGGQDYLLKTDLDPKILYRAIRYAIERKQSKEAIRESEERYSLVVQGTNDGIWDWNILTNEVYFSPRWAEVLICDPKEMNANLDEWLNRIHPSDIDYVRSTLNKHIDGQTDFFKCEHRLQRDDETYIWVLVRGLAVRDQNGTAYRMAGSLTNINTQKETEEILFHNAFHDSLTGLPNRALFSDRLTNALERFKRNINDRFAVLFFDLDRFKLINDSLGHMHGDQLLIKVAEKLKTCLRACDSAARLSGDEFAILLEDINNISEAAIIAERIQNAIQTPTRINGRKIVVTASIGVILSDLRYTIPEDILRDADIAMYHAKMRGKACYAVFQPSMHKHSIMRMELENELREILSSTELCNDHLFVVYQPIISSQDEKILGFETLVRWQHPIRGVIMPGEFIPLAEETGLIHPLGVWVLRQACRQVRIWQAKGLSTPDDPLSISVNISGTQFSRPDLVDQIKNILQEFRISPDSLNLEITERLLVEHNELIIESMRKLRKLGVNLQIDDFGRGYSSFSYLQHIPVNTLKIDSLFTQRIGKNRNNSEIIRSIVNLAKSLGLTVIAEGVETEQQFQQLKQLDCEYVQGFFFSKAVSADETEKLVIQNRNQNGSGLPKDRDLVLKESIEYKKI